MAYKLVGAGTFVGVLKKIPRGSNLGRPNESKFSFSTILLKSFLCIHISLVVYAHWSHFLRCVPYGHQRPNFWAILNAKVSKNSGLWSLSQTGFTSVLFHLLIASIFSGVWNMGFRDPILDPKISQNSGLWSFSQKVFTSFTSVLLHMLIASTFRCVENMVLRGPILGPFGPPNK